MYRFRNMLEKSPNTISAAIFTLVQFVAGCIFYAVDVEMSKEFAALILSGESTLVLVLSLFVVQPNTVTNQVADAQVAKVQAQTTAEITDFLANAPAAKPSARTRK